jgi:hypothetical protein
MQGQLVSLAYEIDLHPGERAEVPADLLECLGPGKWLITVRPVNRMPSPVPFLGQTAFLNSYGPEDEGLYDDLPAG